MAELHAAVTDTHPLLLHAAGTPDHVYAADRLRFSRDPFDALIAGAAQVVGLALVTRDGPIRETGTVAIVW